MGCLLCGYKGHWSEVLSQTLRDDKTSCYSVVRCAGCGHVQLSHHPTKEEDSEFYNVNELGIQQQKAELDTVRRFKWLQTMLPSIDKGKILDVGCGYGFFIHAITNAGYKALGLDVSTEKVALSQANLKGEFICGTLDNAFITHFAGSFTVITLFHVLEHLTDPVSYLKAFIQLLRPNGCLILELPNLGDGLLGQIPEYRTFYWQRAHLSYFDYAHLDLALRKAGFTQFNIKGVQRYGLHNLIHWIDHRYPQLENPSYQVNEQMLQRIESFYKTDREIALTCDTLVATVKMLPEGVL